MRHIYTVLFYLSLPVILLRLLWRARKNPAYAKRWPERFGVIPHIPKKNGIWLHAVSVGESLAAIPLIKALQQKYPDLPIIITNTTPTGAERIQATFKKDEVAQFYLPYDIPMALQLFLNKIQPRLAILMETELWPNLLYLCGQRGIPVMLANARLSARSARGYQRIASLTRGMLQNISLLAVQTQTEADRFIALGLKPDRVQVTGSIKFDLEIPSDLTQRAAELRAQWGQKRFVWIAASTHEGEEEILLNVFEKIRKVLPECLLVLVPRHPDRFPRVAALCKKQGYEIILRSENKPCDNQTQVFIGDSMGELLLFYAASDVAFVGGSLVPTGGHNPLEPAALGLPVLMGPHLFNFAAISEQLQQMKAMIKVNNADALVTPILELLRNETYRKQMGEQGLQFVSQNRGALKKHLELIQQFLLKN